jgi:hypothetical protein
MTTTIERFHVDTTEHPVHFEENGDLTVHLLRGGQRDAEYAEWGSSPHLPRRGRLAQPGIAALASRPSEEMLTEAIERLAVVRDELRGLAGWLAKDKIQSLGVRPGTPVRSLRGLDLFASTRSTRTAPGQCNLCRFTSSRRILLVDGRFPWVCCRPNT